MILGSNNITKKLKLFKKELNGEGHMTFFVPGALPPPTTQRRDNLMEVGFGGKVLLLRSHHKLYILEIDPKMDKPLHDVCVNCVDDSGYCFHHYLPSLGRKGGRRNDQILTITNNGLVNLTKFSIERRMIIGVLSWNLACLDDFKLTKNEKIADFRVCPKTTFLFVFTKIQPEDELAEAGVGCYKRLVVHEIFNDFKVNTFFDLEPFNIAARLPPVIYSYYNNTANLIMASLKKAPGTKIGTYLVNVHRQKFEEVEILEKEYPFQVGQFFLLGYEHIYLIGAENLVKLRYI